MESDIKECDVLRRRIDALERKVELLSDMLCRLSGGFRDLSEATRYSNYVSDDTIASCNIYDTNRVADAGSCDVPDIESPVVFGINEMNRTELVSSEEPEETETVTSPSFNFETRYLGSPSGEGFEVMNERESKSVNSLYILKIDRERNYARFYPNMENSRQLVNERGTLLEPVCEIIGELQNATGLNVFEENYGELQLNGDYWTLVRKCKINLL